MAEEGHPSICKASLEFSRDLPDFLDKFTRIQDRRVDGITMLKCCSKGCVSEEACVVYHLGLVGDNILLFQLLTHTDRVSVHI